MEPCSRVVGPAHVRLHRARPDLSGRRLAPHVQPLLGRGPRVGAFLAARRFGRQERGQRGLEGCLGATERHAVLRASGTRDAGFDIAKVELERVAEDGLRRGAVVEEPLRLHIGFDQRDPLLGTARQAQIVQGCAVHRKDRARRSVFGRHVADRSAVDHGNVAHARTVEFDEPPHHALLAQELRHGEHEVGRGRAFAELAGQLEADDFRNEHRNRLAEHRGLRLDAADAPAQDAEAIHHRRVRVRPDQRVRIGERAHIAAFRPLVRVLVRSEHDPRQIFDVDLVADAAVRRRDAEILECLLAPFEQRISFAVARVVELLVDRHRARNPEGVGLDRMVDDEFDRLQGIDLGGIAAEPNHGVAHRREVDDRRNPCEILQQNAGGLKRDLGALAASSAASPRAPRYQPWLRRSRSRFAAGSRAECEGSTAGARGRTRVAEAPRGGRSHRCGRPHGGPRRLQSCP